MCGLLISHKFKVHSSGCVPYITKSGHHGHLARYIEYLMHFIVSRAHLGQLISNLAKVGSFTVYWVIHDIMPRTGT